MKFQEERRTITATQLNRKTSQNLVSKQVKIYLIFHIQNNISYDMNHINVECECKLKFYFRRAKERKITKRKSDGEGADDQNEGSLSPQSYTS